MKTITSKNTSVNKDKLPKVYTILNKHNAYGTHIFDVGCGKYTRHIKNYAQSHICEHWHGFDPYNKPESFNAKTRNAAHEEKFKIYGEMNPNIFISSNVLNVIQRGRGEYLQSIFRMMKDIDECYITVYEGNKSGIGRITKKDCWQENRRLIEYLEEVKMAYRNTHIYDYENGVPQHSIDIKYGMIRVLSNKVSVK